MAGLTDQNPVWHPDGHIVLASALGTMVFQGEERKLLAIHPDGGHPEKLSYFGPIIRKYVGFMGGLGEQGQTTLDSIAIHPLNKKIYLSTGTQKSLAKNEADHAVYELNWEDEIISKVFIGGKAGNTDTQFSDPRGIAFDTNGQLYVCDYGNNRIMIFDQDKKLVTKIAIEDPWQIQVNHQNNEFFVLTRKKGQKARQSSIVKFAALNHKAESKIISTFDDKSIYTKIISLDAHAEQAKLWCGNYTGWNKPDHLMCLLDGGETLEKVSLKEQKKFSGPLVSKYDGKNNVLYINPTYGVPFQLNITNHQMRTLNNTPESVCIDKNGYAYHLNWRNAMTITKKDFLGKEVAFQNSEKTSIGPWKIDSEKKGKEVPVKVKGAGVRMGYRGHTIDHKGNVYVLKTSHYGEGKIDVHAPTGEILKEDLITGIPQGSSSIQVDYAGNLYLGVNIRDKSSPYFPLDFDKLINKSTFRKYKEKRDFPWNLSFYNPYMYHWGGIIKFSPKGGKIISWKTEKNPDEPKPEGISTEAKSYQSGYLTSEIAIEGSLWYQPGFAPIATSGVSWGDASCNCTSAHFSVDPYGRSYVPDIFTFSVHVFDAAGNHIEEIGSYGTPDSSPEKITFFRPYSTDYNNETIVVTDSSNEKISLLKWSFQNEILHPILP